MSQSDAAMRTGMGGANVPPSLQSSAGVTDLHFVAPVAPVAPTGVGTAVWLHARKFISFPALMGLLLVGAVLVTAPLRLPDPDTWWHIAVGQHILETHTWPTSDPYSFTAAGVHWVAYEWLGEAAMGFAWRVGGLVGVEGLYFSLVALVILLLYYHAYVRSGNWKAACLATAILLPVAAVTFTLRPQLFGYIFLLLTLICLEKFRQGHSRALWFLPPLFLIWVNAHGTFVFGLAAIGLYYASGLFSFQLGGLAAEPWTGRQRVQLLLAFLLCCVATVITPYGTELAAYPAVMAASQPLNIANIQEWQPLSFGLFIGKYLLAMLLAIFLAHVFFPWKYRLQEMGLLLFGVYAACVHIRFVLILAIIAVPVLAGFFAKWMPPYDPDKDRYAINLAAIAMVLVAVVAHSPRRTELTKTVYKDFPVAAVEYLRAHPQPAGMFNDYFYGGYLIWQLGPQQKVFIDGRADLYEYSGVFQDYLDIGRLNRNTFSLLNKYGIQSCLTDRKGPLATLLSASPDWKQDYADDLSVIFVRSRPPALAGN